jgi:hypothetical protein
MVNGDDFPKTTNSTIAAAATAAVAVVAEVE